MWYSELVTVQVTLVSQAVTEEESAAGADALEGGLFVDWRAAEPTEPPAAWG
jgi:hypothetical protein